MAFDDKTRRRLFKTVTTCRNLLTDDFDEQLRSRYGIYADEGRVRELDKLTNLDESERNTATALRERIEHLAAGGGPDAISTAVHRIRREQAFTILNRLAAVRMAEERKIISQSVGAGLQSTGFRVFEQAAGAALGSQIERYLTYLDCLFDELSLDLGILFDRSDALGLLFPSEKGLRELFDELNDPEIAPLWAEDETIGWIYQYYNDPEERKKMRKDSAAPRNSRELAVRNQFFTPRYVVEFLTDNTLGRIWYEMTSGQTRLAEQCRYLVRRPTEIFLTQRFLELFSDNRDWVREVATGNFADARKDATFEEIGTVALLIDGYAVAEKLGYGDVHEFTRPLMEQTKRTGKVEKRSLLDHWLILFSCQRGILKEGNHDRVPELGEFVRKVWEAWCDAAATPIDSTGLSQDELLKQPVIIPVRLRKDPREIRLLDPACGSMHFGLYAFDLFEVIYEEAWDNDSCPALQEAYASKDDFLKDVPRLIIEHNIHGVDIDPRAVQIAGLSLWLRAQKAWQIQGVKPTSRPRVRRSNIVCAEPMPGSPEMLEDFVATLDPPLLGELARAVFDKMQLAGEAGSLLKIEEEIRTAIETARKEWEKLEAKPRELFSTEELNKTTTAPEFTGLDKALTTGQRPLTSDFFDTAEQQVIDALRAYAEQADADSYQRRLFADDAARGFAFIDLCRKRYDAVVMNPPFGAASSDSSKYIKSAYGTASFDLFASFLEGGLVRLEALGAIGAITTSSGFYRNQVEKWRSDFFLDGSIRVCADLGGHVLDGATVRAASYVRDAFPRTGNSVFIRCNEASDKQVELLGSLDALADATQRPNIFVIDAPLLREIPGSPLAYWLPERFRREMANLQRFGDVDGEAQFGLSTKDDFRFLRLTWESQTSEIGRTKRWCYTSKGGSYSPFYFDIHMLASHANNFQELEQAILKKYPYLGDSASWVLHRENSYYSPGITFQRRTNKPFAPRVLPMDCLFTDNGPTAFWSRHSLLTFLGLFNSSVIKLLAAVGNGALEAEGGGGANSYEVGIINNIVVPKLSEESASKLEQLTLQIIRRKQAIAATIPDTRVFVAPVMCWNTTSESASPKDSIDSLYQQINDLVSPYYGFAPGEVEAIIETVSPTVKDTPEDGSEAAGEDKEELASDLAADNRNLISYLLGTTYGRWDIRYASGLRQSPELPDPFAPIPVCPPGMLQNAEGLSAESKDIPVNYPLHISWPGILVDDENHPEDIIVRIREAIGVIWEERAETIEQEACELLGVRAKPRENLDALRVYFRDPNRFFKDHLARYSKSRRKAPIYWPLSTESGSFTLWIYYHRLDSQTLYTCVRKFIDPKREDLGQDIEALRNQIGTEGTTEERQKLEDMAAFQQELKVFRDQLIKVADMPYHPNLNDGVQITAAPLWECFRHRPWQTALKKTWTELSKKGLYEWAHIAMSMWPDRVTPKCASDRSLAIAHGIEDLLWVPDSQSRKADQYRPLRKPEEELKLLETEHSKEDIEKATKEYEAAKALGLHRTLWVEQPEGTWRRRLTPKQEIEAEINRRKGR